MHQRSFLVLLLTACQVELQPLPEVEDTPGRYLPTGPTGTAYDLTPPETEIASGPDAETSLTSATFTFASPSGDVVAYQCVLDGAASMPCQTPVTFTGLSVGSHRLSVAAIDDAGNVDATPATFTWVIAGMAVVETTIDSVVPGLTNDGTFEIAFSSTVGVFECELDAAGFLPCASPFPVDVSEGAHLFRVRAAGDLTPASVMFTVDTTPPVAHVFGDDFAAGSQAFSLTCDGGPCTFLCALDAGAFSACSSAGQTPGAHTLRVLATDAAQNVSTEVSFDFRVITGAWLRVASGGDTTCAISGAGRLYCWGDAPAPIDVAGVTGWRDVSVGNNHVCAVSRDGKLFCFDAGDAPAQVGSAVDWYAVSVGTSHQCAKKRDRSLHCWQGGAPALALADVGAFAAGNGGTCAAVDGSLFCFGDNTNNRLGLGTGNAGGAAPADTGLDDVTAVDLGDDHGCVISAGAVRCFGNNSAPGFPLGDGELVLGPRAVVTVEQPDGAPLAPATALGVGGSSACAVAGTLSCWGENDDYELGIDVTGTSAHAVPSSSVLTTFAIVAMGDDRACAITYDGALHCWGGAAQHPTLQPPLAASIDDDGAAFAFSWGTGTRAGERFVLVAKEGSAPVDETDGLVVEDPATSPVSVPFSALYPGTFHFTVFRCGASCVVEHELSAVASLVALMRAGGYAVFLRHARATTCTDAPQVGDAWWDDVPATPEWWDLPDPTTVCPSVRAAQIDATGIAQASAIGMARSAATVSFDWVYTSEHDRAERTATYVALPTATPLVGLTYAAEYLTATTALPAGTLVETVRCAMTRYHLRRAPTTIGQRRSNTLVVGSVAMSPADEECVTLNTLPVAGAVIFKVESTTEAITDPETGIAEQRPTLRYITTVAFDEWTDALQE